MIQVSKLAAEKIKEVITKQEHPDETMVRVFFGGYGWGGPRLQLTLDGSKEDNDILQESEGIKVVFNADIEHMVQNAHIDFSQGIFGRGFEIKGPNTSNC